MSKLFDDASLAMIPSAYKDGKLYSIRPTDGSGDFTFSRGSNLAATRVDVNGLIEKGRENLYLHSNNFSDAEWDVKSGTFSQGVSDPNGGSNAWSWTSVNTAPYLYQRLTPYSGISCLSIWVKGVGSTIGKSFQVRGGSGSPIKTITLTSDWQRVEHFGDYSANPFVGFEFGIPAVTGEVVHIYQAQYEQGLVATDYIETGASTAQAGILEDMPRLDYSGSCPALLLEPQRTNQCSYSEYIGDADWSQSGITRDVVITQTSEINPEGSAICWKIQGTSANNQLANNSTTTSGTTITNSIYVKRVSGTGNVLLRDVINSDTSFSLSAADGWKRIDVTATATSSTARFYLNLDNYTDEILVWGAQQEVGSYPTSYIPTYGSSVTRTDEFFYNYDDLQDNGILGSTWTFMYDQTYQDVERDAACAIFLLDNGNSGGDGQTNVRIALQTNGSFRLQDSDGTQLATSGNKILCRYNGSTIAWFIDGSLFDSHNVTDVDFANLNRHNPSGSNKKTIRANQVVIFPTALTDSECIALTTL